MAGEDPKKIGMFLSAESKKLPALGRRLAKQTAQMKTYLDVKVLDSTTILRQTNASMKEIVAVDKELEKIVSTAQALISKLPKDDRKKVATSFNSGIAQFEKAYLDPCLKTAAALRKSAEKKIREKVPDIDAGIFTAWLDVAKFAVDVVKKARKVI